ncbi:ABC-F family ATP-binding cassette domain-containing protein [Tuwongella immobilis]|uniref:ABC transporter domain-containing protein n=1 Tax=Tuwongella immobilis TaxID=692036 RepID=A0A6C2YRE2_9BACT|nr:ABC-F family ATP-binding cassette domain-containing protein [Tuwongella immobilis]VIP04056.1 multidrug abc transporter atp-binding protein : ATPase component of ABC transporters with duplicated ATPase domain OS=Singulisphaera acidiphila (strain ATCC BAA-1392 / DSM 18658 / VKM B-2454 / MOB10) GN=Sinac_5820 PE=3 SV=1: ABC_tran: ABC_tran_2: ABC_tran [Tuwongella immobilis]VTS05479.1 multidrug abc transporter atp-binding protein : ATPase component of ABC transporters with duplicated ATPase domain O
MLVMSCKDLSRAYDKGPLFEGLSFELFHGERVGLVGPNGAGKTTLMRILAGQDQSDTGEVKLHAGARLRILDQQAEFAPGRTLIEEARSAFDELLAAQDELIRVGEALAEAKTEIEQKSLFARFERLNELLSHNDAYTLDHKIEQVLAGLNFKKADFDREVRSFSGGQQRRLLLAKLLLAGPDVMLLDEPSNHLDIDTVRWLEGYLIAQSQAMIIVSHDRYFLNKVTTKTFELHNRRISSYPGNYDAYVKLRAERYEQELKAYESQREYIEKQEEYIRRVNYGQLAKQAQSRQKQLDKLEIVEKPTLVSGPNISFGEVMRTGDVVFEAIDLTKRYGDRTLFERLSFAMQRGKRLGIMGPNGCGKTTLLKIMLGKEQPTSGTIKRGHLVTPGYLDQHLKLLDEEKSVIRAVWPIPDPDLTEQKMRDLLGRFGLSGPIVEQKIGELSGGERSRAALARLVVEEANVLILDEPTNHLDIWACDSLEEALRNFEGSVIVVSHDRYFLNRVCDLLIVFEPNKAQLVYGNYDTYELLRAAQEAAAAEEARRQAAKATPESSSNSAPTNAKPAKRKRKFPYRKVEDIEADIATQETEVIRLEALLADTDIYRDPNKLTATMQAVETTKNKLAELYLHWEEASELN